MGAHGVTSGASQPWVQHPPRHVDAPARFGAGDLQLIGIEDCQPELSDGVAVGRRDWAHPGLALARQKPSLQPNEDQLLHAFAASIESACQQLGPGRGARAELLEHAAAQVAGAEGGHRGRVAHPPSPRQARPWSRPRDHWSRYAVPRTLVGRR